MSLIAGGRTRDEKVTIRLCADEREAFPKRRGIDSFDLLNSASGIAWLLAEVRIDPSWWGRKQPRSSHHVIGPGHERPVDPLFAGSFFKPAAGRFDRVLREPQYVGRRFARRAWKFRPGLLSPHANQITAMQSISTETSRGRRAASTVDRAGGLEVKNSEYTAFISAN